LLDERGRLLLKGSAFRSRGIEPFQRQLIEELVRALLLGRRDEARKIVDQRLEDFASHRVPLKLFARTETLQESVEGYREKVTAGQRPISAAYELALASGRAVQPGDQVSYYVVGRTAGAASGSRRRRRAGGRAPRSRRRSWRARRLLWRRAARTRARGGGTRPGGTRRRSRAYPSAGRARSTPPWRRPPRAPRRAAPSDF